jgi:hypothetical protein
MSLLALTVGASIAFSQAMAGSQTNLSANEVIRIERTPCFGRCPVYQATISKDGTIRYRGERFVEKVGNWKGTVNKQDLARIQRLSDKLGFFSLKASYRLPVTDLPTTIVTIRKGNQVKRVSCYGEEPDAFWVLSLAIDDIVKDSQHSWQALAK